MKNYLYLLIFIFVNISNGQTLLNDSFSSFQTKNDNNVQLLLRANNSNANIDNGKNGYNYTANNFSVGFADELVQSSKSISGGNALQFHTDSLTYFVRSSSIDSLKPGTSDFTIDIIAKFETIVGASFNVFWSMGNTSTQAGHEFWLTTATGAMNFRVHNGTTNKLITDATNYKDGNWHIFTGMREGDSLKLYVDGVLTASAIGVNGWNITPTVGSTIGRRSDGFYSSLFQLSEIRFSNTARTPKERKEAFFLADGWYSMSGGVTRANLQFNQGVVSDTIYYNTVLTAGSWSVTLSDSAASGVNYEVLTSADATTWTTLASGTTGTSWGSKSYSGDGTGYVAIAVASGTAFFDDLVVTLASDDENGFGDGFSDGGWNGKGY